MRWIWIDRVLELRPRERLVAVKNITAGEDWIANHFPPSPSGEPRLAVFPACFVIEGMAQTAGILVCEANDYKQKVVLAKIGKAELTREARPGCVLRYTATVERLDTAGASTKGVVELSDPQRDGGAFEVIGQIDLLFSHLDNNFGGAKFPEHNFVFSEGFKDLLRTSGFYDGD
jgi:3-hydroxyacyl-[acyl-carrier-protein] dehydratase